MCLIHGRRNYNPVTRRGECCEVLTSKEEAHPKPKATNEEPRDKHAAGHI